MNITVNFTPHLLPADRGILSTIYGKMTRKLSTSDLIMIYRNAFRNEPFIKVLDENVFPDIKDVRGSNDCQIGIKVSERTNTLIVVSAIDNLVKGASGQAAQNMNIMMGFEETTALQSIALVP
jgi:N-acetyl-gamma-glutamyl-phosphate reductase